MWCWLFAQLIQEMKSDSKELQVQKKRIAQKVLECNTKEQEQNEYT